MPSYNDGRPRGPISIPGIAPGGPAPGTAAGGDDWFTAQAPAAATAPPAAPPIQDGMASAQQSLTALQNSPGYQFRLGEGLKALERSAAARGTLLTGGTLKGLTRYGQEFASNEYDKRNQQLFGWANLGANAASNSAASNTAYGRTAGDLITNQGNANAAAGTAGANAWNQALGGIGNDAMQMFFLSKLMQPGASGGTPPYAGPIPQQTRLGGIPIPGITASPFPPQYSGLPPLGNPWG